MKRILVVFHDTEPQSGATASMLDIIDGLISSSCIDVEVLVPKNDNGLILELNKREIKIKKAFYVSSRYLISNSNATNFIRKIKSLLKLFLVTISALFIYRKLNDYDYIYTNTSDIYVGALLSYLTNTKHVWHIREFGYEDQGCLQAIGDENFYKLVNKVSNKVIVISNSLKNKVEKFVPKEKIEVIYNDINYNVNNSHPLFPLDRELNILIVGSIVEQKGQKLLIEAVRNLKNQQINIHLGIAGKTNTDYARYLIEYTKELGIEENVKFIGFRKDLEEIRNNYDIGVVASTSEAFGRVTIEGMLSGLLMLGSDGGANPELIMHKETGFLYENNNVNSIVEQIKYIDQNRERMDAIIDHAREFAMNFNCGKSSGKIIELLYSN